MSYCWDWCGTELSQRVFITKNPGKKGRVSHLSYIWSHSVFLSIEPGASFSHMLNCIVISWVNCKQLLMSATETFLSEWVSMRHILKVLHHYPTVKFVMLLPALLTCLMKHWIWAFYYCLSLGLIITEDRMYDMNMKWSHLFAWPGCM